MRVVGGFAYLTAAEMAGADKSAIEEFGVDVLSLMENAGVATANAARRLLGRRVSGERVVCLVGKGNNGGDGLVAARHLCNWGADVAVVLGTPRGELREAPAKQLASVEKLGIAVSGHDGSFDGASLLIDALLGYGSRGNPSGNIGELIRRANGSGMSILAVDLPSGLDATTGARGDPCVVASATVTFGLPKTGFLDPGSRENVGELYLADISLPRAVYQRLSPRAVEFPEGGLVEIDLG